VVEGTTGYEVAFDGTCEENDHEGTFNVKLLLIKIDEKVVYITNIYTQP